MKAEDIEKLLNIIRKYPELYAVGHVDYKNTNKKNVAWRKIQEKIGIDAKTLKAKWRNLRDTYKKYKKRQQISSGQATKKRRKWVWADQMSFIDSPINLRQTNSTLDTSEIIQDTSTPNRGTGTPNISTENENENAIDAEQVPSNEQNELRAVREPETAEINVRREEISRKRRRVSDNDSADKNIYYLKAKNTNVTEHYIEIACDREDMEFLGYADIFKSFSLPKQAIVKLRISEIKIQAQLQELNNSRSNSTFSNASSSYDDSNISPMQFTEQPSYYVYIVEIHIPFTQNHESINNPDSSTPLNIARIHMSNTQTHSVPNFIHTNSQNLELDDFDDSFCSSSSSSSFVSAESMSSSPPLALCDKLSSIFRPYRSNLNIVHINAQSIPYHYSDLVASFNSNDIDAVLISESFLKPSFLSTKFLLPGFVLIRNDRTGKGGGGVAIYLRANIQYKIVNTSPSLYSKSAEYLAIEITAHHNKLLLIVFYSPNLKIDYFDCLYKLLNDFCPSYNHVILMGDFNKCLLKNNTRALKLKSLLSSLNLHILPTSATHHSPNCNPSLLDLMIVSSLNNVANHGQLTSSFCYHDLVFLSYRVRPPKRKPQTMQLRSFRNIEGALLRDIEAVDLSPIINSLEELV